MFWSWCAPGHRCLLGETLKWDFLPQGSQAMGAEQKRKKKPLCTTSQVGRTTKDIHMQWKRQKAPPLESCGNCFQQPWRNLLGPPTSARVHWRYQEVQPSLATETLKASRHGAKGRGQRWDACCIDPDKLQREGNLLKSAFLSLLPWKCL